MPDTNKSLQWFRDHKGKITYSMNKRLGVDSADCSSSEYQALIQGGFLPSGIHIGNTDSLFYDLEQNGFAKLRPNSQGNFDTQAGDIFIWGKRGASGGVAGHTGEFADTNNVWNCRYTTEPHTAINLDNYDYLHAVNGYPEQTFYRYVGSANALPSIQGSPTDQVLEKGSTIKFTDIYTVDEVKLVGDVWQVKNNKLCPKNFTWEDNGIPAEPLIEVDADGYATTDQDLSDGPRRFIIPGKFTVLDLGEADGVWLALISYNGLSWWVDVSTATEIAAGDAETSKPGSRPPMPTPTQPQADIPPNPEKPAENTQESDDLEEVPDANAPTDTTEAPTTPHESPSETPINSTKPKEETMAFSAEDQKALKAQTEDIQSLVDKVANSDEVQDLVKGVSKRVKLTVYIVADSLIGLGLLTPNLAIITGWHDLSAIVALSGACATAGAFLLTMFGIYKNGQN